MMDRRFFVKLAAGAAAGSVLGVDRPLKVLADQISPARFVDRIGLQLYTVRSLMEKDFAGTLEAVANVGYDEVEFAGYFDHEPGEVKDLLARLGLDAPACHLSLEALRQDLRGTIALAQAVGHRFIVAPWLDPAERDSIAGYRKVAADLNDIGKACRDSGLRFGWHNHDFELQPIDGTVPFDVLLDETDPELVEFEPDLYWVRKGGADILAYFEKYPGRFTLCHVKDMGADGGETDVGSGTTDFKAIFTHAEQAGLEHYFVELDNPADPMASITASHGYLAALTP